MHLKRVTKVLSTTILILLFLNKETYCAMSLNVDARASIAIDVKSKRILFDRNSTELIPMASTTKIMTSLVALSYGELDKEVTISKRSASIKGSTVGYKAGEKVKLRELLYGLMLRSGNDAAIAIAEGVGGDVDSFLKIMNDYAKIIGVLNTHFESPHGLDSDEHYSTAYDLALITAKAMENKTFREIVACKAITKDKYNFTRDFNNINKILYQHPDATGVKTGYTGKAGKCLVSSFKLYNNDIVIVVLNSTPRWKETLKVYKYIDDNYEYKKLYSKGEILDNIVIGKNNYKLLAKEDVIIPVKKGSIIDTQIIKPTNLKSEKINIGRLAIYEDKTNIFNSDISYEKTP